MRYLLIYFIVCFCVNASAQSVQELDIKNGLNGIKFGTTIASFKNKIVKTIGPQNEDEEYYKIIDPSLKKFIGYDVESVILFFAKGKLYAINVDFFEYPNEDMYKLIKYKLEKIFGIPVDELAESEMTYEKVLGGYRWKSINTKLDIMNRFRYRTQQYTISVFYSSEKEHKKALESQF